MYRLKEKIKCRQKYFNNDNQARVDAKQYSRSQFMKKKKSC